MGRVGPQSQGLGRAQESGLVVWACRLVPASLALKGMKSPCIFKGSLMCTYVYTYAYMSVFLP